MRVSFIILTIFVLLFFLAPGIIGKSVARVHKGYVEEMGQLLWK